MRSLQSSTPEAEAWLLVILVLFYNQEDQYHEIATLGGCFSWNGWLGGPSPAHESWQSRTLKANPVNNKHCSLAVLFWLFTRVFKLVKFMQFAASLFVYANRSLFCIRCNMFAEAFIVCEFVLGSCLKYADFAFIFSFSFFPYFPFHLFLCVSRVDFIRCKSIYFLSLFKCSLKKSWVLVYWTRNFNFSPRLFGYSPFLGFSWLPSPAFYEWNMEAFLMNSLVFFFYFFYIFFQTYALPFRQPLGPLCLTAVLFHL